MQIDCDLVVLGKGERTHGIVSKLGQLGLGLQIMLGGVDGVVAGVDCAKERPVGLAHHSGHFGLLNLDGEKRL
jgi:hypothetical protein